MSCATLIVWGELQSQQRSEAISFKMHVCVQAVMGKLLKGHLAHQWGIDPARIYHCAVMPCYDKKLEASREDFNLPGACPAVHSNVLKEAILLWLEILQHCRQMQVNASDYPRTLPHKPHM